MAAEVWLIGNRGMLGSEVDRLFAGSGVSLVATDRDCDITDIQALRSVAAAHRPRWIVNCSAYTAVDKAEDESDLAFRINADGVENIGKVAAENGANVVHISTDYVFDGTKEGAYTEEDPVNPLGVYGRSKAEGERRLLQATERSFIIRTAWLYGMQGSNFAFTMLRLFRERESIRVVDDQWGSPTYAPDLAHVITGIVEGDSTAYGIYHFTNEGRTSWHEFARAILREASAAGLADGRCRIDPIPTEQYPTKARRPKNSFLSKDKIRSQLGIEVRPWEAGLRDFFGELSRK